MNHAAGHLGAVCHSLMDADPTEQRHIPVPGLLAVRAAHGGRRVQLRPVTVCSVPRKASQTVFILYLQNEELIRHSIDIYWATRYFCSDKVDSHPQPSRPQSLTQQVSLPNARPHSHTSAYLCCLSSPFWNSIFLFPWSQASISQRPSSGPRKVPGHHSPQPGSLLCSKLPPCFASAQPTRPLASAAFNRFNICSTVV